MGLQQSTRSLLLSLSLDWLNFCPDNLIVPYDVRSQDPPVTSARRASNLYGGQPGIAHGGTRGAGAKAFALGVFPYGTRFATVAVS